jgi:hypothetical protein
LWYKKKKKKNKKKQKREEIEWDERGGGRRHNLSMNALEIKYIFMCCHACCWLCHYDIVVFFHYLITSREALIEVVYIYWSNKR